MRDKTPVVNRLRINRFAQFVAHDFSDAVDQFDLLMRGIIIILTAGVNQMKRDINRFILRQLNVKALIHFCPRLHPDAVFLRVVAFHFPAQFIQNQLSVAAAFHGKMQMLGESKQQDGIQFFTALATSEGQNLMANFKECRRNGIRQ
ncbi:hypothetical protein D3C76_1291190 [compost metagenome]